MSSGTETLTSVLLVHLQDATSADALRALRSNCALSTRPLRRMDDARDEHFDVFVFDLAGCGNADLERIQNWRHGPQGRNAVIVFITDEASRSEVIRLGLNHEANLVKRPLDATALSTLVHKLRQLHHEMASDGAPVPDLYALFPQYSEALRSCDLILDDLFGSFKVADRLAVQDIAKHSTLLVDALDEVGLNNWVDAVRAHHNVTYQHCLLVTGTLLAFGNHLKMQRQDLQVLAIGGLLHDLGKADVPLAILDKPSSLTPVELEIMRTHPLTGVERLKRIEGTTTELVSFVRDHHEYLDGSGYPNGLMAASITDPVRLLTIADIFAALVERRSYKPEMTHVQALDIMHRMQGKLDAEILTAVTPVLRKVAP